MSHDTHLSDADLGKRVVNSQDEQIGHVVEVSGDVAYVDPVTDPAVSYDGESESGPGADDEDRRFQVEHDEIESITPNDVRLTR